MGKPWLGAPCAATCAGARCYETGMKPWVTWVLIGANVAMFGVELASGLDPVQPLVKDMVHLGADFGPLTLGEHEWWRVLSSMFLHFGVLHIAMNMLCLWQARGVEKIYGHGGFAAIYFVAGILGGVGSVARNGDVVAAGASGAVFGVFGAFAAFLIRARKTSDRAAWQQTAQRLGTFIVINLVIGLQSKGIDVTAHVVGLIAGLAAGFVVPKFRAIPTLAVAVALAVGGLLALPAPAPRFDRDAILDEFHRVEHECLELFNTKLRQQKANEIDRNEFATAIEQQIIPKWHAMRLHVEAIPELAVMRQYLRDRELAWSELVQINREHPVPSYHDDEAQANADAAQLATELKQLTADK